VGWRVTHVSGSDLESLARRPGLEPTTHWLTAEPTCRARASSWANGPALIHNVRQSFVCPNRCVLKLPRSLTGWWCFLPLKLPGESRRKRPCNDAQGVLGELGIPLGGFRESEEVQLRVDLNRLHATIITSRVEALSLPDPLRDVTSTRRRKPTIGAALPTAPFWLSTGCTNDEDLAPGTRSFLIGPGRTPSGSTGIRSIIIANVAALAALVARRAPRILASI
jgi:hypothetical protein